jgi:pimeloyl-ACP methyl ester carboxylesterase
MSTTAFTSGHRLPHLIAVAIIATALLNAAACGTDAVDNAVDNSAAPTSVTATTPTTPTITNTPAPSTTAVDEERPTAPRDELVGVEGARVHVRCTGSGDTTVVLIAGHEAGSDAWSRVEPVISARTRTCAYDRPGTGTSDPATATATFATQASELHDLLAAVGEPGPYVVVGHSFGDAEAVTFASEFDDEVAGVVLVDASPVTWPEAICAVADDGSAAATMFRDLCASWSDPSRNVEHLDVFASFAGASTISSLGSLPMSVITAVDRQAPGLAADEVVRLTDVWNRGQQYWSQLSTAARVIPVEDASHQIQLDHPDLVIAEIARLLP